MAYELTKRNHGKQSGKVRAHQHPKVHVPWQVSTYTLTHTQKREKNQSINTTIFQDDGTQLENILYTLK